MASENQPSSMNLLDSHWKCQEQHDSDVQLGARQRNVPDGQSTEASMSLRKVMKRQTKITTPGSQETFVANRRGSLFSRWRRRKSLASCSKTRCSYVATGTEFEAGASSILGNSCSHRFEEVKKPTGQGFLDCNLNVGCTLFNKDPVEGLSYLLERRIIDRLPAAISDFLLRESRLSREAIGEFFSMAHLELSNQVLREFLHSLDMVNLDVDQALRVMLQQFYPAMESKKLTHLIQTFGEIYVKRNAERVCRQFRNTDTVELLAFSILLLNTQLHHPNLRRSSNHISVQDFIDSNRGIDAGADLPDDMLRTSYARVLRARLVTLPDPVSDLRQLDALLLGPLKTRNFIQRHRRFLGWTDAKQLDGVPTHRNSIVKRPRLIVILNDLILLAKALHTNYSHNDRMHADNVDELSASSRNPEGFSDRPMRTGKYQVCNVLLTRATGIISFKTARCSYGVAFVQDDRPIAMFELPSERARIALLTWSRDSMEEMAQLQRYYKGQRLRETARS